MLKLPNHSQAPVLDELEMVETQILPGFSHENNELTTADLSKVQ